MILSKRICFFIFFLFSICSFGQSYNSYDKQEYEIVYIDRIICIQSSIVENGAKYIFVYKKDKEFKVEAHFINYGEVKITIDTTGVPFVVFRKATTENQRSVIEIHLNSPRNIDFN